MKGQVHIAFHYKKERLEILKNVISNIKSWEDETEIIVHTNDKCFDLNEIVIEHKNLAHPFFLCIAPTLYIKDFFDESFDFFVYMEDDIIISKETYAYWKRHQTPNLGFLRITDNVLCDLVDFPLVNENVIVFKQLYKAFWINTNKQMKEYLKEDLAYVMFDIKRNISWSRERAAFGNSIGLCFIPIDELQYAYVDHLGFDLNSCDTKHIKIKKEDFVSMVIQLSKHSNQKNDCEGS